MAIKYLFPAFLLLLAGCDNPKRNPKPTSADTAATPTATEQPGMAQVPVVSTDTAAAQQKKMADPLQGLPDLMEGDIIVQSINNAHGAMTREAMQSEWSNAGIIFRRDADGVMIVVDAASKVRITPLAEWIATGENNKLALYRLKNADQRMSSRATKQLRTAIKDFKAKPTDEVFDWGDNAYYSTELVWKAYQNGLNISLCPLGTLGDFKLDGPLAKPVMTQRYGKKIPRNTPAVSIANLCASTQLDRIYAR